MSTDDYTRYRSSANTYSLYGSHSGSNQPIDGYIGRHDYRKFRDIVSTTDFGTVSGTEGTILVD